jgi:hypothetical protein
MLWWVKPRAGFTAEGRQQSGSITECPIGARGKNGTKEYRYFLIACTKLLGATVSFSNKVPKFSRIWKKSSSYKGSSF